MGTLGEVVRGLLPTVGVSLLFAAAIWAIVRADAAERAGRARLEAEEDAADAARARSRGRPATRPGDRPRRPVRLRPGNRPVDFRSASRGAKTPGNSCSIRPHADVAARHA